MLAAAMASFVACFVIRPFSEGDGAPVVALLTGPFLTLGATCMLAAIVMAVVMPSRTEIIRQVPPAGSVPGVVVWLLVALGLVAAMQVPALWAWWQFGLQEVWAVMGQPDRLGLWLIPAAIVSASPVLAALTVLACTMTSALGITARATVTIRVLAAGTALQAGLVIAGYVMQYLVSSIRDAVRPFLNDAEVAAASALFDNWFGRHDLAATTASFYLLIVVAGYVVVCIVSTSRSTSSTQPVAGTETLTPSASALPVALAAGAPPPERQVRAASMPSPRSTAASVLPSPMYSVRPRIEWLEFLSGRHWEYVFDTVPPTTGGQLSFSWRTGVLRSEPHGPELLRISPATRPGRFMTGDYSVQDGGTGQDLGRMARRASDWELLDAGQTLAYVLEVRAAAGSATYAIRAAGQDVCRASWVKHGLTIHSAELLIEFLPGADLQLDRSLVMAIAPILEQQARLKSERYT